MTQTNNIEKPKPKRGPGRPKKYFTDEERKQADKRYVKECMERNPYYCHFYDHAYHMASKSKHLKGKKKHIRNIEKKIL